MKKRKLSDSFYFAIKGFKYAVVTQPNMKFHLLAAVLALALGLFLQIETVKMLMVIFAVFLVLVTEMFNTSIESTVDLYTSKKTKLAAVAKDVAAGAVMLASLNAVILGFIAYYQPVNELMKSFWVEIKQQCPFYFLGLFLILVIGSFIVEKFKYEGSIYSWTTRIYAFLIGFLGLIAFELWRHLLIPALIVLVGSQFMAHTRSKGAEQVYLWVVGGLILGIISVTFINRV